MTTPTTTRPSRPSPAIRVAGALAGDLLGYALFWSISGVVTLVVATALVSRVGTVDSSMLQGLLGVLRWIMLAGGVIITHTYPALYAAHGITRRHVLAGCTPVAAGLAATIGVIVALGFALEGAAYRALGWSHALSDEGDRFLYDSADQYGLIAVATAASFLAYLVSGGIIGVAFARWSAAGGILFLPVGIAPLVVAEVVAGGGWLVGPFRDLGITMPSTGVALAVTALVCAAGWGAIAALLRDVEFDNDKVNWWR